MTYQKFNEFCQNKDEYRSLNKANNMCETLALLNIDPKRFVTEVCLPVILENQFSNEDELIELFGEKLIELTGNYVVVNENVFGNAWGKVFNRFASQTPQTPTRQVKPPSFPDVQKKAKAIADILGKNIFAIMNNMQSYYTKNNDVLGQRVLKGIEPKIRNMIQRLRFVGGNDLSKHGNPLPNQPMVANTNQNTPQPTMQPAANNAFPVSVNNFPMPDNM